ncbi:D-alanyl-lipoteichoic acid biosynthesis protein DltD [Lactobacillus sp. YT155]|uniref:D-alanyl-lipoteichoic acid biosynthesis protein DltD n=1 Tax=Lactobacillus sp. YT155 TaxID=3060955 RepID=UPI00265E1130|nr:D-alanyl-lipoteichoic acid biosynthesis protein DltD [Lactobacillus sp. YT155]MDO1605101.1 D-alanyl-lipoteichoic acid biosynthesis protein DltD [Lactobacillus sp. YT155]
MQKRLWQIFGPLIIAVLLVAIIFVTPFQFHFGNLDKDASAMSSDIIRGDAIKNAAMKKKKFVPFFGSSELNRFDAFHPSVLAQKYDRSYRPFLLGAPGTQSISQAMMVTSMQSAIKNKKAVFIISPQWFVKKGIKPDYFNAYFSELQTLDWVLSLKKISKTDKYLANRLLSFKAVQSNSNLVEALNRVAHKQQLTKKQRQTLSFRHQELQREDQIFSGLGSITQQPKIDAAKKDLPDKYDMYEMSQLAEDLGEANTNNNEFKIDNKFFDKKLRKRLPKFRNFQHGLDYRYSPEYADFQVVLNQFAKEKVDVLFIIPPVNQRWQAYTGLPPRMLRDFDKRITYQLRSQGFNNIADFSDQGSTDYFMADTIHLGWYGWLQADQYINKFLSSKERNEPTYTINDEFLTNAWTHGTGKWSGLPQ